MECKCEDFKFDTCFGQVEVITGEGILQAKKVNPKIEKQLILPDEGYTGISSVEVSEVTKDIDNNIVSSNIKKGVTILGVTGELISGQERLKELKIKPTIEEQIILPDMSFEGFSKVTVAKVDSTIDANIKPENIVKGKNILGVEGTYDGGPIIPDDKYSPIYTSIGGYTSEQFTIPNYVDISTIEPESTGYEVTLEREVEYANYSIDRQSVAIENNVQLTGIKMYDTLSQEWKWIFDDQSASLFEFPATKTIIKHIKGQDKIYQVYANSNQAACGERRVRFYTKPKEV